MSDVRQLTAVIEREGDGFLATCPELDVVSQGNSVEEARSNLLEGAERFLEVASSSEIQARLEARDLLPGEQLGDAGYISGPNLARSQKRGIELTDPIPRVQSPQ